MTAPVDPMEVARRELEAALDHVASLYLALPFHLRDAIEFEDADLDARINAAILSGDPVEVRRGVAAWTRHWETKLGGLR